MHILIVALILLLLLFSPQIRGGVYLRWRFAGKPVEAFGADRAVYAQRPFKPQPGLADEPGAPPESAMKRITPQLLYFIASILAATAAMARDMDDQYAVFGVGAENCAAYLVARDQGAVAERWYHHWLAGYLSAVNNAGAATYNIIGDKSMADILDWLDGYCSANPNVNYANAIADMVAILYQDRQNMAPDKHSGWGKFTEQPPGQGSPAP